MLSEALAQKRATKDLLVLLSCGQKRIPRVARNDSAGEMCTVVSASAPGACG